MKIVAVILFFTFSVLNLMIGSVDIPLPEVFKVLLGISDNEVFNTIILENRLPQMITAIVAGSALSASGLIMQTVFANPLAGPSVLGISTGASLGVAVVTMFLGVGFFAMNFFGAIVGALIVLFLIMLMSQAVRSNVMLLIVGMMISYLASSLISLISYVAQAQSIKSFVIWEMGSFSNVRLSRLPIFCLVNLLILICGLLMSKPLNAMLLGDNYARLLGFDVKRCRNLLLLISGSLTACVTAYCGPISFIGLAVPHIARMIFKTADHFRLMPATIVVGAVIALICNLLCVTFPKYGILPLNTVTSLFGAPVAIYVAINGRNLR